MRQALELAAQVGHVPVRISGPPIDMQGGGPAAPLDTVTGEWGVPDGRGGVIPLEQAVASRQTPSSPAAPRTANTSLSDQLRSGAAAPSQTPSVPPSTSGPMVSMTGGTSPRPPGVQGPLMQNGQYGDPANASNPMYMGRSGPPNLGNPRYDFPQNATGQPAGTGPIIVNVNTPQNAPPSAQVGSDVQSRHYQLDPNFYNTPQPGGQQPTAMAAPSFGNPQQMTQDYRRWLMENTGLGPIAMQLPGMFAGAFGQTTPSTKGPPPQPLYNPLAQPRPMNRLYSGEPTGLGIYGGETTNMFNQTTGNLSR